MKPQYIFINSFANKFYFKDKEHTILHREDGPAVERTGGSKEWYLNGRQLSEQEFLHATAPTVELTIDEIAAKFGVPVEKLKIKK